MKSFHDLREASEKRNGRQSSPNPDSSYPSSPVSTAPEVGHNARTTPSAALQELCENCSVLNVEGLTQPSGHKHSMLSELLKSRRWCRLCYLVAFYMSIEIKEDTTGRYQVVMSVSVTGDGVEGPESNRGWPRSLPGHGNSRTHMIYREPSRILVEIVDLRPWEGDMGDKLLGGLQMSPAFQVPDGSKLVTVGGVSLHCLTEEHDPATEFGIGYVREVGSDTSSSRSFEVAAGWLADCLSAGTPPKLKYWEPPRDNYFGGPTRPYYKTGGSEAIAPDSESVSLLAQEPLRLVEFQPDARGKEPSISLIHTDGHHYQYAALSYCWGRPQPGDNRPWQTKQATLESHLKGINKHHLPKTLQDAISICDRLHISHLWVDSLCIIQDSPSDWAAEAAKMSGIYLGSLLTVSLSSSLSAESGCFNQASQGVLNSNEFQEDWIKIDTKVRDGRRSRLYVAFPTSHSTLFEDEVEHGVLSQRAWALQEHVMPRRTLYITLKQLLWECWHCRLSEDNYPQLQGNWLYPICHLEFPLDTKAIKDIWYRTVIEDYTRRQLTHERDKLVAISALARATFLHRHIDYVAGLWVDCIVPGLLWMRSGPGCKSKTYSCPTWSWASQNSAVIYRNLSPSDWYTPDPSESYPSWYYVSWKTKPENNFGDVLFAYVDLETTITLGTVLRDNTLNDRSHPWTWAQNCEQQTLVIPGPGQNGTLCAGAVMDDEDGGGQNVAVANMGHCLLLLAPPSLSSEAYRRVGFAFPDPNLQDGTKTHMDDITRGWKKRAIRLI